MLMEITSRLTALLLIVALLPLLFIIALVSLVIQGLPIIFIQPRVGRNFKKFNIYNLEPLKIRAKIPYFRIMVIYYR